MANNQLQTLTEIFNNRFFRIPDYQRGYAWQKEQLNDFWEDIENLRDGKNHYTGLLTIEAVNKKDVEKKESWETDLWLFQKGFKACYVIDGQQRLTTSIILLEVILSRFDDSDSLNFEEVRILRSKYLYQSAGKYKSFVFGYERDNPSDEYLRTAILGQNSSSADKVPKQTLYTANLQYAKDYFITKTKELSTEELESIFAKVVNGLKFNLYEIDEELDVFVTFETMNNRGKPLSKLELLKNRLIYLTTILPDDESDRNKLRRDINEVWKTIYEYLGKDRNKPLDDDDFLEAHWRMYFKYDRKVAEQYAKFLLDEYFIAKNVLKYDTAEYQINFDEIKKYIDSISDGVKVWFYLFNPNKNDSFSTGVKIWLNKLNRLGFGAFESLIMASFVKNINQDKIVELLKACERFVFLVFRITRRQTNTQNNNIFRMTNRFYKEDDDWTIDNVIAEIEKLTDGEDENYYYGWYDIVKFHEYIEDQYKKEDGFYSWNGLRYFLYEYELYLQERSKGEVKVTWDVLKKANTIEHIYPQEDSKDYWKTRFGKFSSKKRFRLCNSLGNLLLLSQSKNSELQNLGFDFKRKHKAKNGEDAGYFNGSYSEIGVAQNVDWTDETIRDRGIGLLEFMEHRWKIEIENKDGLLGIDVK